MPLLPVVRMVRVSRVLLSRLCFMAKIVAASSIQGSPPALSGQNPTCIIVLPTEETLLPFHHYQCHCQNARLSFIDVSTFLASPSMEPRQTQHLAVHARDSCHVSHYTLAQAHAGPGRSQARHAPGSTSSRTLQNMCRPRRLPRTPRLVVNRQAPGKTVESVPC